MPFFLSRSWDLWGSGSCSRKSPHQFEYLSYSLMMHLGRCGESRVTKTFVYFNFLTSSLQVISQSFWTPQNRNLHFLNNSSNPVTDVLCHRYDLLNTWVTSSAYSGTHRRLLIAVRNGWNNSVFFSKFQFCSSEQFTSYFPVILDLPKSKFTLPQ